MTLTDGGQAARDVAERVAVFLARAKRSLDLALYDVRLTGDAEDVVLGALRDADERGVDVRLAFNVDHPNPIPVPPPPEATPEDVENLPFPTKAIAGVPDLMHHKYAVRDLEAVLTGSVNWTDDSWSRQENVLVVVDSPALATDYARDFEQIWASGVEESGPRTKPVAVDDVPVQAWFAPHRGEALSHRIAARIARARRRVRIASPVLTSAPILGTLAEVTFDGRLDVAGIVDATQLRDVFHQWKANGNARWKVPLLDAVLERAPFAGKESTPWGPATLHDFMHAKVTVADDDVFVGSFNLSHSGEKNAENVLELHDAALANRLASYIDEIRERYPRFVRTSGPGEAPSARSGRGSRPSSRR